MSTAPLKHPASLHHARTPVSLLSVFDAGDTYVIVL